MRTRFVRNVPGSPDDASSTPANRLRSPLPMAADIGSAGRPVPNPLSPTTRTDRALTLIALAAEETLTYAVVALTLGAKSDSNGCRMNVLTARGPIVECGVARRLPGTFRVSTVTEALAAVRLV